MYLPVYRILIIIIRYMYLYKFIEYLKGELGSDPHSILQIAAAD